jgi:hypothetical protein
MVEEIKTTGVYSGRDIINEHVLNDKQVPSTRAVICVISSHIEFLYSI